MDAGDYKTKLQLIRHPEGGWYREMYRAQNVVPHFSNSINENRNLFTHIYYLLENQDYSAFHKIGSEETWHYYAGNTAIEIVSIVQGKIKKHRLGNQIENGEHLFVVVPANTWFAARLANTSGFALSGCTVVPGFDFADFKLATESLVNQYPELADTIRPLLTKMPR
jgi:predicted cupin superfamily sugar epimerase